MSSSRLVPAPADLAAVAAAMLRLNETIRLKGQRFEDREPTAFPRMEPPEDFAERARHVAREHDEARRVARSWDDRLAAVEKIRAALEERLRGNDFLAPHEWPGEVDDALEAERVALGDREAFDLRACLILEDADPALFEGGLRQVFRPSEIVAEAMADREERALLIKSAAEAAMEAEGREAPAELKGKAARSNLDAEAVDVKATAAAFALRQEGKPISLRAVCKRAGIDRDNLAKNYPATVSFIEAMSQPDRAPKRGVRHRRTGDVDAYAED